MVDDLLLVNKYILDWRGDIACYKGGRKNTLTGEQRRLLLGEHGDRLWLNCVGCTLGGLFNSI